MLVSRPERTRGKKKIPKSQSHKRFEPRGEEKIRSERARSNWLELLPHRPIHSSPTKAIHSCEISENEPVTRRVYEPIRLLILYTLCMLDAAMGESICFASASFHHELFFLCLSSLYLVSFLYCDFWPIGRERREKSNGTAVLNERVKKVIQID